MMNFLPNKEEVLYIFDPTAFKRISWISLISCTVIVLWIRNVFAVTLLVFVATALILCWYTILQSLRKVDLNKSTIIYESTRDSN
jgi:hypothetical protein